jgi:ABC-type phosphate transport system permease subunit
MSNGIDILDRIDGQSNESKFEPKLESRQLWGKIFAAFCILATSIGLIILAFLIFDVVGDAASRLNWDLFQNYPSRRPLDAGYRAAILGSVWMLAYVLLLVIPLGVSSAIYLEEYAKKNWLSELIELNIYNLAGIPSIIYGLLGLGLFVRGIYSGRAVLVTGILTITLLILPPVIVISREAIHQSWFLALVRYYLTLKLHRLILALCSVVELEMYLPIHYGQTTISSRFCHTKSMNGLAIRNQNFRH